MWPEGRLLPLSVAAVALAIVALVTFAGSLVGFSSWHFDELVRIGLAFMLLGLAFMWAMGLGALLFFPGALLLALGIRRSQMPWLAPTLIFLALPLAFLFGEPLDEKATSGARIIGFFASIALIGVGWSWFGFQASTPKRGSRLPAIAGRPKHFLLPRD